MEEDKIKKIFTEYDPKLSSSLSFMERLERNMIAVELIHKENAAVMKRNRMAIGIASLTGFITGVTFALMFPYIDSFVHALFSSMLSAIRLPAELYGFRIVTWLLIGGVSVIVALNTYTLALGVRASKDVRREG